VPSPGQNSRESLGRPLRKRRTQSAPFHLALRRTRRRHDSNQLLRVGLAEKPFEPRRVARAVSSVRRLTYIPTNVSVSLGRGPARRARVSARPSERQGVRDAVVQHLRHDANSSPDRFTPDHVATAGREVRRALRPTLAEIAILCNPSAWYVSWPSVNHSLHLRSASRLAESRPNGIHDVLDRSSLHLQREDAEVRNRPPPPSRRR